MKINHLILSYCLIIFLGSQSVNPLEAKPTISRIDPPFWFAGFTTDTMQLLVYGNELEALTPEIIFPGISVIRFEPSKNKGYMFVDLKISDKTLPGTGRMNFIRNKKIFISVDYEIKARDGQNAHSGFGPGDVIYLLMPDRFANGNPANDNHTETIEKCNRKNPDGRHGGDLKGITDHLDYLSRLGVTAVWPTPVLENNNPSYSYHGYAITDLYKVDPRLGTNDEYRDLVKNAHEKNLKVVMDMVFNHLSIHSPIIKNLPDSDWINTHPVFTRSNFRAATITDPYASEYDRNLMNTGWFDHHMADLNQQNPRLMAYLTQNTLWWIEFAGIDAIRMDTWPYPFKSPMSGWAKRIMSEYPSFTILGETWEQTIAITAAWQQGKGLQGDFETGLNSVTDFPLSYALAKAFTEPDSWTDGLFRLYYHMAQDFLFAKPGKVVGFVDNHDLTRFFENVGRDTAFFKMGLAFLLTTNRIPQIYYGTEIAMTGLEHQGHGFIRQDFPGGWVGDTENGFNLIDKPGQNEIFDFVKLMLNWRKNNAAVQTGKFIHFIPENGVYVYFRVLPEKAVMVIINKNNRTVNLDSKRFIEILSVYGNAKNIITNQSADIKGQITLQDKSVAILELTK